MFAITCKPKNKVTIVCKHILCAFIFMALISACMEGDIKVVQDAKRHSSAPIISHSESIKPILLSGIKYIGSIERAPVSASFLSPLRAKGGGVAWATRKKKY